MVVAGCRLGGVCAVFCVEEVSVDVLGARLRWFCGVFALVLTVDRGPWVSRQYCVYIRVNFVSFFVVEVCLFCVIFLCYFFCGISVFAIKVVRPKFTQKIPPKELN